MDNTGLIVHVDVCQKSESSLSASVIEEELEKFIQKQEELILNNPLSNTVLPSHIKYVKISTNCSEKRRINCLSEKIVTRYHIYQLWEDIPVLNSITDDSEETPSSLTWCLPNASFEGLWESLVLESGVKEQLMSYVETTLLYSSKQVNAQVVHWNGVILLHGPPGTGKTSLCKALAQKISIRLNSKYRYSQLVEINTHSLLSKWFSKSAKLVHQLFTTVKEGLQSNDGHFICILMDEVESLTFVRRRSESDPADSVRAVNALLTEIDQLQRYPNFLILGTTNVTDIIDTAFADRADLKLLISYPSKWGIYEILRTCVEELINCDLIKGNKNEFFEAVILQHMTSGSKDECNGIMTTIMENSKALLDVSTVSEDLSGRTLRKIPFLTSMEFVNKGSPSTVEFIEAIKKVVLRHKSENDKFFCSSSIFKPINI